VKITGENVVEELKKKNPDALEYSMDTYGAAVYWLVYRVLVGMGRPEDIEECVSDVYVSAWQGVDSYDPQKGTLKTWILILAKYKALDWCRKLGRTPAVADSGNLDEAGTGNMVEQSVLSAEEKQELIEAIKV